RLAARAVAMRSKKASPASATNAKSESTPAPGTRDDRDLDLVVSDKRPLPCLVIPSTLFKVVTDFPQQQDILRSPRRRGGFLCFFFLPLQPVNGAHQEEHRPGDDEEADDIIEEHPIVDRHGTGGLGFGQGSEIT